MSIVSIYHSDVCLEVMIDGFIVRELHHDIILAIYILDENSAVQNDLGAFTSHTIDCTREMRPC